MSFEDIPHCDVFHPTPLEFQYFQEYIAKIQNVAKSGIVKIVPPKGYKPRKDDYKDIDFIVPHPIEQIVGGKEGNFELVLLQRESRSLSKYAKLVKHYDKITENKKPLEIEKMFWRTLKFNSPLYGADAPGSLFDKNVEWNLSELDSLLKRGLGFDITGVTSPYLYIGSWKAMFAWHKEDLDLYSINYLHFGSPKCWYGIPSDQDKNFESLAIRTFPEAYKECKEFLRHKTYLINPLIVRQNGITVHKCVQNPGEFVVTFCGSYHAGFNMGYNCAEAVNFAIDKWIPVGKKAGVCKCHSDSVKIDMKSFVQNIEEIQVDSIKRKKKIAQKENYKISKKQIVKRKKLEKSMINIKLNKSKNDNVDRKKLKTLKSKKKKRIFRTTKV